ncbi:MAG: hypothetical protein ACJ75P_00985 [Gaiellaceae bacterium]
MAFVRGKELRTVAVAQVATPGTVEFVAAPGGKLSIPVVAISFPAAGTIKFQTSTGGVVALTGADNFAANGGMSLKSESTLHCSSCPRARTLSSSRRALASAPTASSLLL